MDSLTPDFAATAFLTDFLQPSNTPSTFSQQMLAALLQKGFSKKNIAKELDISVSTLNRLVRGTIFQPANKTFSQLLRLYCAEIINANNAS